MQYKILKDSKIVYMKYRIKTHELNHSHTQESQIFEYLLTPQNRMKMFTDFNSSTRFRIIALTFIS